MKDFFAWTNDYLTNGFKELCHYLGKHPLFIIMIITVMFILGMAYILKKPLQVAWVPLFIFAFIVSDFMLNANIEGARKDAKMVALAEAAGASERKNGTYLVFGSSQKIKTAEEIKVFNPGDETDYSKTVKVNVSDNEIELTSVEIVEPIPVAAISLDDEIAALEAQPKHEEPVNDSLSNPASESRVQQVEVPSYPQPAEAPKAPETPEEIKAEPAGPAPAPVSEPNIVNEGIDLSVFKGINPETVGYIRIGNTNVDYPVLQRPGDNEYYLHHDIYGNETTAGSIYIDSAMNIDGFGNHVFYGHHMKDGSMFKDVSRFSDRSYFNSHNDITVFTGSRTYKLTPVTCFAESSNGNYLVPCTTKDEVNSLMNYIRKRHDIWNNVEIHDLFVFVTCSYQGDNYRTYLICTD